MAAPNIVNVNTITGVVTFVSSINTEQGGMSVIASNPAASGKVLKINTLTAAGVGATTGVTIKLFNQAAGAGTSVSIGATLSVPKFSTLAVITKENSIYVQEDQSIAAFKQAATGGNIDIICSYEDIS
tara:strand:- start:222 stop:605 length:384 start_codon:yes stop_codon:yes gene_type:complete